MVVIGPRIPEALPLGAARTRSVVSPQGASATRQPVVPRRVRPEPDSRERLPGRRVLLRDRRELLA
jgi:hypothetical protein